MPLTVLPETCPRLYPADLDGGDLRPEGGGDDERRCSSALDSTAT